MNDEQIAYIIERTPHSDAVELVEMWKQLEVVTAYNDGWRWLEATTVAGEPWLVRDKPTLMWAGVRSWEGDLYFLVETNTDTDDKPIRLMCRDSWSLEYLLERLY